VEIGGPANIIPKEKNQDKEKSKCIPRRKREVWSIPEKVSVYPGEKEKYGVYQRK